MRIVARFAPIVAALALAVIASTAGATLVSGDSSFGPGTITADTQTGLVWLDLTESAGLTHAQVLQELIPGGTFEGFRLATRAEVAGLFADAGFDLSPATLGSFVPQNFDPAVALAALVGQLGNNGNCGTGCSFSFSSGFLADPPSIPDTFAEAGLAWFDNSAGLDPTSPAAPVGRAILEGGAFDTPSPGLGAWLVAVPEPGTLLLLGAALAGLTVMGRRRER